MSIAYRMIPSAHEELPLAELAHYPSLQALYSVWKDKSRGGLPAKLSPLDVPRSVLPYVMLLDLDPSGPRLRVRLAGTEVCLKHGSELKGKTTDDFFEAEDAGAVVEDAVRVAETGQPSLARRSYITLNDRLWSYTRIILPLSSDGERIDSFFKALAPESLSDLSSA